MKKSNTYEINHFLRTRKGFVLVLVVVLVGVIALLGASLVSLSQIENASTLYKVRLRTAQNHAKASLHMAFGDLQKYAGRDQTITALADGFRLPYDEDLRDDSLPVSNGGGRIYQPFWTGVWDNNSSTIDTPIWLVTRPFTDSKFDPDDDDSDGDTSLANPFTDPYDPDSTIEYVTLVGPGTAVFSGPTGTQNDFNVVAPMEAISTDSILGEGGSNISVGKIAYWTGDLGVKGNYGIPLEFDLVTHDDYANESTTLAATRLRKMIPHLHRVSGINPESATNENRLKNVASNFQLRSDLQGAATIIEGLTLANFQRDFHGLTALSRGVLVDPSLGGLKKDLTPGILTGNTLIDNELLSYINVESLSINEIDEFRRSYTVSSTDLEVAPIIKAFHINFAFEIDRFASSNPLRIKYSAIIELWNPYTSAISNVTPGAEFEVSISGFPRIEVTYTTGLSPVVNSSYEVSLASLLEIPSETFRLDVPDSMRPGQLIAYAGWEDMWLNVDTKSVGGETTKSLSVTNPLMAAYLDPTTIPPDDVNPDYMNIDILDTFSPTLTLKDSAGTTIGTYTLGAQNYSTASSISSNIDTDGTDFGYTWNLGNPDEDNRWFSFDPRVSEYGASAPLTINPNPIHEDNKAYQPEDSTTWLLGYNHTESDPLVFDSSVEVKHDIPMLELPRQELSSVGSLQHAKFSSGVLRHLGRPASELGSFTSYNDLFDSYFFSTLPQGSTTWSLGDRLPNTRMKALSVASLNDLQTAGLNSAQYLLVDGMFNINSTSLSAWQAVLQGLGVGNWRFYKFNDPLGDSLDFTSEAQFSMYSQSAEETYGPKNFGSSPSENNKKSFRRGLVTFPFNSVSSPDIATLAQEVVKRIRQRIQASGPFTNIQEFLDADVGVAGGVLNNSIQSANLNANWVISDSPRYLTQGTIMNGLAPFLSTRSDTFLLRAYGDVRDPNDEAKILARAYCEAIAQRLPSKHSSDLPIDVMLPTSTADGKYGREFRIIAFRWLSPDEI